MRPLFFNLNIKISLGTSCRPFISLQVICDIDDVKHVLNNFWITYWDENIIFNFIFYIISKLPLFYFIVVLRIPSHRTRFKPYLLAYIWTSLISSCSSHLQELNKKRQTVGLERKGIAWGRVFSCLAIEMGGVSGCQ